MDSFVLLAYTISAALITILQRLLACLNFALDSENLFCWYKQKSDLYELWQQLKQLKTMEMSVTWPDTYDDIYINSNLKRLIISSSKSTEFKDILPWNISEMITKTVPISTRIE